MRVRRLTPSLVPRAATRAAPVRRRPWRPRWRARSVVPCMLLWPGRGRHPRRSSPQYSAPGRGLGPALRLLALGLLDLEVAGGVLLDLLVGPGARLAWVLYRLPLSRSGVTWSWGTLSCALFVSHRSTCASSLSSSIPLFLPASSPSHVLLELSNPDGQVGVTADVGMAPPEQAPPVAAVRGRGCQCLCHCPASASSPKTSSPKTSAVATSPTYPRA